MMGQKHQPNTLPAECGRCQGEFWAPIAEIHASERAQIEAREIDLKESNCCCDGSGRMRALTSLTTGGSMPINKLSLLAVWLFSTLLTSSVSGQSAAPGKSAKKAPAAKAAAAPKTPKLVVALDLDQRLAKFRPVKMPFNSASLSLRERRLVEKLVEASRYLENILDRKSVV